MYENKAILNNAFKYIIAGQQIIATSM